jgi:hypothetical protein
MRPEDIRAHREPGWWIPIDDDTTPEMIDEVKADLLKSGEETKLDRLFGIHSGVPFKIEVGQRFVEPDDGHDHGIVITIIRDSNVLRVITTGRGAIDDNPVLVGHDEVVEEVVYELARQEWERGR